ncbi:hypothetical protein CYMTET_46413, partial [Cymbomonas tetramitiformis]
AQIKEKKRLVGGREKDTLERLKRFKTSFNQLPERPVAKEADKPDVREWSAGVAKFVKEGIYYDQDDMDEGDAEDWMTHSLKFTPSHSLITPPLFEPDTGNQSSFAPEVNDYIVVDPLIEKNKQKFSKDELKRKKRELAWAGGTNT